MRKLLLIASLVLTGSAMAANGPAGCGLGKVVLEGKTGLVWNVVAATLNGTSGNQTFGMSSGTSGCDVDGDTAVSQVNFIEANKVALSNDIARGEGETLAALGNLYGCENVAKMGSVLKGNYSNIFSSSELSANELNERISGVISTNKACI